MTKGFKMSKKTRARMKLAAQKQERLKRAGLKRADFETFSKLLPLQELPEMPFPASIAAAIEFGFRCHERGMNLSATMEAAFEVLLAKVKAKG